MCTFLALETFSTKKCGCFWQVRLATELFLNINRSSQRKQKTNKDHSRVGAGPAKSQGSPGLNLSTMHPMVSRGRRCPASCWQAGRAPGKRVMQGPYKVPSYMYTWC